jgi:hypothetical protein
MTAKERHRTTAPPATDLETLRPILRAAWGADTCDPHDLPDWHAGNPARGQCGVTALIVQDLLGGDLILGEVFVGDTRTGHHYWNRLADGREVDLTAGQFRSEETVVGGQVQQRPPGSPGRCRRQYETLQNRVLSALDGRMRSIDPDDGDREARPDALPGGATEVG